MFSSPSLTAEQQRVVRHAGGHARVGAVAGSGKTTTMIGRIGHLLGQGVKASEIMVLMFNRSARDSFAETMSARLGDLGCELPEVRTFHSLGHRLVGSFVKRGALADYQLVTEEYLLEKMARQAAGEIYRQENDGGWPASEEIEEFLTFIDLVKSTTASPPEVFKEKDYSARHGYFLAAFELFEKARKQQRLRFYADLIHEPVMAMQADAGLGAWVGNRVGHVIVDEYQDINEVQQRLLRCVAGSRAEVMVVGDVDQCIYEWRGARPDFIISRFALDFPRPVEYQLSHTFRYGHGLSLAANYLIGNNVRRDGKICISHVTTGFTRLKHLEEKGRHPVVDYLIGWQRQGRQLSEAVVLVRLFAQSVPVELALLEAGIPYRLEGSASVFGCSEVMALVGYLKLSAGVLVREEPVLRQKYVQAMLSQPHLGIKKEDLDALALQLSENLDAAPEVFRKYSSAELPPYIRNRFEEAAMNWQWLLDCAASAPASWLLAELAGRLRLYDFYYSLAARGATAENRVKTCRAFIDFAGAREESAGDFLARIEELRQATGRDDGDQLLITSIHRAKGLEWPLVILPGLEDGVFPFIREQGNGIELTLEDERRLFYVAMTRAIEEVVFCHPVDPRLERNLGLGCTKIPSGKLQASRFLHEANIEWAAKLAAILDQGQAPAAPLALADVGMAEKYCRQLGVRIPLQAKPVATEPDRQILRIDELFPGQGVFHPSFGAGTVVSVDDRRQGRLRVDFASQGETVLLAAYARLQPL